MSVDEIKDKLEEAKEWVRKNDRNAGLLRENHLKELDRAKAEKNNSAISTETKSRLMIETQREQGRMLRYLKNKQFNAVDVVTITEERHMRECAQRKQMEEALFIEGHQ